MVRSPMYSYEEANIVAHQQANPQMAPPAAKSSYFSQKTDFLPGFCGLHDVLCYPNDSTKFDFG